MRLWNAAITSNLAAELATPGKGYCGFVAMDRIVNGMGRTIGVDDLGGVDDVLSIIRTLIDHSSK